MMKRLLCHFLRLLLASGASIQGSRSSLSPSARTFIPQQPLLTSEGIVEHVKGSLADIIWDFCLHFARLVGRVDIRWYVTFHGPADDLVEPRIDNLVR